MLRGLTILVPPHSILEALSNYTITLLFRWSRPPNVIYRPAFRDINIRKRPPVRRGPVLHCLFGCACFVPEPGQNIHLPLSKKKQAGLRNGWAFLSMFWFWSALTLTLNQRV